MADRKLTAEQIEEGTELCLDFDKITSIAAQVPGVIPVAVQDADTREVLVVAYANREALQMSLETGIATFWSTSRNELWMKGATSGNTFELVEIRVNCEQNSLLYLVRPKGEGICHTYNSKGKVRNCYYRRLNTDTGALENLDP